MPRFSSSPAKTFLRCLKRKIFTGLNAINLDAVLHFRQHPKVSFCDYESL